MRVAVLALLLAVSGLSGRVAGAADPTGGQPTASAGPASAVEGPASPAPTGEAGPAPRRAGDARSGDGTGEPGPTGAPAAALPPAPDRVLGAALLRTPPLDLLPVCVPRDLSAGLAGIASAAAAGRPGDALEALSGLDHPGASDLAGGEVLRAILLARTTRDRAGLRAARAALRRALAGEAPASARVCARLEASRVELLLGFGPEAAAHAARAAREGGPLPPALERRVAFLRAEARYLGGDEAGAAARFAELVDTRQPEVAVGAALRLADAAFDHGDRAAAFARYPEAVGRLAELRGVDPVWLMRTAEAAIAAGAAPKALPWLTRLDRTGGPPELVAAGRIRQADLWAASGQAVRARDLLLAIEGDEELPRTVRMLASVRMADLGVSPRDPGELLADLRAAALAPDPLLATYGRSVLLGALLERGEFDEALDVAGRLLVQEPPDALAPGIRARIDALLRALAPDVVETKRCRTFVMRVGGRRRLLIGAASEPAPLVRLGECYAEIGLLEVALEVYRSVAASLGLEGARAVVMPMARAAFEAGDLEVARTAARAYLRQGGPNLAPWRLLLGEVELEAGRLERAREPLVAALRGGSLHGRDRVRGLLALARVASRRKGGEEDRRLLHDAFLALDDATAETGGGDLGEAALLTAELFRRAGEPEPALALYRLAADFLPDGFRLAEATYWLGSLSPDPDERRTALERAAGLEEGGRFASLARHELEIAPLRAAVGRSPGGSPAELRP